MTSNRKPGQVLSGRRIIVIAVVAGIALSAAAATTARRAWHALYVQPAVSVQHLYGQVVWPDRTRRPPALGLTDQSGGVFQLSAQAGKVVVLTFMDSACTSLCPVEARELADVRTQLPYDAPVELVVVSTDPAKDTPASVRAFAARAGWDRRWQWYWLTGSAQRLARIWKAYKVGVDSASDHTSVIYIVGQDGYERAGLGVPARQQEVVTDLKRLGAT